MTLTDQQLQEMEWAARRFQGAWTGTSGSLAAMLLQAVQEVRRLQDTIRAAGERRGFSSFPRVAPR